MAGQIHQDIGEQRGDVKWNLSAISWLSRNKGLTSHRDWLHWSLLPSFQRDLLKAAPLLTKLAARKTIKSFGASQMIFKARPEKVWTPSCTYLTVTVLLPLPRTCYLVVCNLEFWVHYLSSTCSCSYIFFHKNENFAGSKRKKSMGGPI